MQVLGVSTTEERGGYERRNTAKDARGTTGHCIDVASRKPEREEKPLGLWGRTTFRREQCNVLS
jgi:hypothetical protein